MCITCISYYNILKHNQLARCQSALFTHFVSGGAVNHHHTVVCVCVNVCVRACATRADFTTPAFIKSNNAVTAAADVVGHLCANKTIDGE